MVAHKPHELKDDEFNSLTRYQNKLAINDAFFDFYIKTGQLHRAFGKFYRIMEIHKEMRKLGVVL